MKKGYHYSDVTQKIIGCAVKVHNTPGNGFPVRIPLGQKNIYQRCLAIEMEKHGARENNFLKIYHPE